MNLYFVIVNLFYFITTINTCFRSYNEFPEYGCKDKVTYYTCLDCKISDSLIPYCCNSTKIYNYCTDVISRNRRFYSSNG